MTTLLPSVLDFILDSDLKDRPETRRTWDAALFVIEVTRANAAVPGDWFAAGSLAADSHQNLSVPFHKISLATLDRCPPSGHVRFAAKITSPRGNQWTALR